MSAEVLEEEYEVLCSIFPEETTKVGEHDLEIRVVPEEQPQAEEDQSKSTCVDSDVRHRRLICSIPVVLLLKVHYPPEYPDVIPDLDVVTSEGEISDEERHTLLDGLRIAGEESLGMAMVFTLVSFLQESVRSLVEVRTARREKAAADAERQVQEKEEARIRGTPVTAASFLEWRKKFLQERSKLLSREDEEKMKAMTPKERDEYKKQRTKLSGRQIFERGTVADDEDAGEEGAESVDISQYDRRAALEEDDHDDEDDRIDFSDSD